VLISSTLLTLGIAQASLALRSLNRSLRGEHRGDHHWRSSFYPCIIAAPYQGALKVHEVLDPAREKLGSPIVVNSGYRCPKHNKEVGGVANSQHMRGEACDIRCTDNKRLVQIIEQGGKYDQLIIYPSFIHVSWKRSGTNRRMKLWSR
jgi:D-alanyl-D-alanine dipeptidase